ncbi:SNF2 family DNA or RNA helicase [Bradyrhizobium sp. GM2.2]|uniref:DISARM system SNF2-like helicase DrmD n=1 Tax=Bradyrhizobium sp. GM2.2 TaxID=3156358 RepID=UPI003393F94B
MVGKLEAGAFVELRGRPWLVEEAVKGDGDFESLKLSCIADDAQGEQLEVIWDAEIGPRILGEDNWQRVGASGPDSADVFAAHLRVIRWNSSTAAERDLFQAPFRAGIRLDTYQLLPLRKALRLPRVNLLIADDVGLGKTVEAGLIARELLLRRRIDFIVVAAPPSMTFQWKDELQAKFGLSFQIVDREHLAEMRRLHGFGVNPWRTGSRFIISHRLLTDETYVSGLRDVLGEFRARALLILDEAHHAAPAGGSRYAISSQFTKAVRNIAERFEHRLFLSATPHNGHSNSFSALLEMLDPQRFTRGVEVRPRDLEPVMVRRLKSDLRRLGEAFPGRRIEAIPISGLPADAPELDLARRLAAYGELRMARISTLPSQKAALAKLAFVGLQQRLLSSVAAFAKTLKVHRASLAKLIDGEMMARETQAALTFVASSSGEVAAELDLEDSDAESTMDQDEMSATEAASRAGALGASKGALEAELAAVDEMLAVAEASASRPDARVRWLVEWIKGNMLSGKTWNDRRLIIFTEYEDSRRWLERRLLEAIDATDKSDERILVFSGATGTDKREAVKRAFNNDPAIEPVRILLCTDAAREGINLQTYCSDLIHFDLPWNPSRLEQRNGRIDRKLQPAKLIICRYFKYEQREADIVLDALVRKTESIRNQLGSVGRVIEERVTKRLAESGIRQGAAAAIAKAIEAESDAERLTRARAEMDDDERVRFEKITKEQRELQRVLEDSQEKVGVNQDDLRHVVAVALDRAGYHFDEARAEAVGPVETYRFDPSHLAFKGEGGWGDAFDDLRIRPRKRGERYSDWRRNAPIRSISFKPPVLADGRDAPNVVQVHLEHRLVRRLLSRFISQGFESSLSRISVIMGPGAQPRIVLMGRLSLYGSGATRLHEEVIPIAAIWSEAERAKKPLKALGESGEARTLDQLEQALRTATPAPAMAVARVQALTEKDIADLRPALESIAGERIATNAKLLRKRGEEESKSLRELLERQRGRISKAADEFDPNQLALPGIAEEERREQEADRRHWRTRLERLDQEMKTEPERILRSYDVTAHRLEPVGIVYLWPVSG